jgi:hypothetical protein
MLDTEDDERRVVTTVREFAAATERGVPREMASFMCADEAQRFLDTVGDPDNQDPMVVDEFVPVAIRSVRVFGDCAVVRFTRSSDEVRTLYCRLEDGRWTVCADAEDDLTATQLDEHLANRALSSHVRELCRTPVGALTDDELGVLIANDVCADTLVPMALDRLEWQTRHESPSGLISAVFAIDRERWTRDIVSLTRARILAEHITETDWPGDDRVPREQVLASAAAFLAGLS